MGQGSDEQAKKSDKTGGMLQACNESYRTYLGVRKCLDDLS